MYGYCGKILDVDLTTGKIRTVPLDGELAGQFIGGSGVAAALFCRMSGERIAGLSPLEPDNPLILMTGPLTGSSLPASGRMVACAKSPLTGIWSESNAGGFFGAELKRAGFDGISIRGCAEIPAVLQITDGTAELHPAGDLWGQDAYVVCDTLRTQGRVLTVGPAGEKMVPYACIVQDKRHYFGRTGMGAVMGSKRLKAVTVKGSGNYTAADRAGLAALRHKMLEKLKESYVIQALSAQGTNSTMDIGSMMGDVPLKNWQTGEWDGVEAINGTAFVEQVQSGQATCFACPVACKREAQVPQGPYAMEAGPGPEYETVASFGTLCLVDNPQAIARINDLCNRYGLDTISCGATIAFAIECFENGLLGNTDTGGLVLQWSDPDLLLELVRQTGENAGFGRLLALGSAALAEKIGPAAQQYLTTVKRLEAPMHDPRAAHGMGLAYATANRGACHVSSLTLQVEHGAALLPLLELDGFWEGQDSAGKAAMVKITQDFGAVFAGAAIFCLLGGIPFDEADLQEALRVTTGEKRTLEQIMACGERIWCLKRAINQLCGMTAADDILPPRLLTPLAEGGAAGSVPDMSLMLKEYYELRGLADDGRFLPEKAAGLGLSRFLRDLR
ncbi:MAG: aldehyde ferredoxin oxidoreductase family protein [Bacillota bacterium]|nr:aldehyde ferredoxin oxidoreductase family protein [Bacillota bacterium]MDW7683289.1 aldehyde ferredoxin oxidoreductase family protein [Bacillota bacterium]